MTADPPPRPATETGPAPPLLFGRYVVRQVLRRGSAATISLATDATLGREVVVKVLQAPLLAEPAVVEQFLGIQRRLAALAHAHLVTLFDARATEDGCFVVMEYLPGGSLADRAAGRRLPVSDVLAIGAQIASALQGLHDAGLTHGQLAPRHVLFDAAGAVKLIDVGGPLVAAPAEPAAGVQADLAALAALVIEILTGRRPEGSPPADGLVAALNADRPDLPPGLASLLARCLAPPPGQRPLTAAEVGQSLATMRQPTGGIMTADPEATTQAIRPVPAPEAPTAALAPATRALPAAPAPVSWRPPRLRPRGGVRLPRWPLGRLGWPLGRWVNRRLIAPVVTLLVGLTIVGLVVERLLDPPALVQVPTLTGQSWEAAQALAAQVGLGLAPSEEYSATVPAGVVIRQAVPPGTRLTNDRAVPVVVSRGPAPAVMPDLRQRRLEEARADLAAAGLVVGQIVERETPRQPWGVVIAQRFPAGAALPRQALVDLTVAVPPWTTVPTLIDRSLGEAEQELERTGLRLGTVRLEPTAGKRAGTVVAQELAPGLRVRHGDRVAVTIAVPPPP